MAQTSGCVSIRSGNALDGCGVGPLAALRQSLFDQRAKVRQLPDAAARLAFAAKIVAQALAIGRLREHSRQREFADTPRGPEKSIACGTRSAASMPRSAATTRGLPRNSEKPTKIIFLSSSSRRSRTTTRNLRTFVAPAFRRALRAIDNPQDARLKASATDPGPVAQNLSPATEFDFPQPAALLCEFPRANKEPPTLG
jgi:hypothetical protein